MAFSPPPAQILRLRKDRGQTTAHKPGTAEDSHTGDVGHTEAEGGEHEEAPTKKRRKQRKRPAHGEDPGDEPAAKGSKTTEKPSAPPKTKDETGKPKAKGKSKGKAKGKAKGKSTQPASKKPADDLRAERKERNKLVKRVYSEAYHSIYDGPKKEGFPGTTEEPTNQHTDRAINQPNCVANAPPPKHQEDVKRLAQLEGSRAVADLPLQKYAQPPTARPVSCLASTSSLVKRTW